MVRRVAKADRYVPIAVRADSGVVVPGEVQTTDTLMSLSNDEDNTKNRLSCGDDLFRLHYAVVGEGVHKAYAIWKRVAHGR
jgi:hypothetical protein